MSDMDEPDWARFGQAVRSRRLKLEWSVRTAAFHAGVSDTTWTNVEAGQPVSELTQVKVARALGWTAASPTSLLGGGRYEVEPDWHLGSPASAPPAAVWRRVPADTPAPSPTDAEPAEMPAGFRRKYSDATPEERAKLEAYLDGLFAARDGE